MELNKLNLLTGDWKANYRLEDLTDSETCGIFKVVFEGQISHFTVKIGSSVSKHQHFIEAMMCWHENY